uniref:Bcl-2 Bcl-2 homology region 1-3 domain-containing protein n=1 Tax=Romanomermis culicivorax TaxID=13658 RepID=A0A915I2A5_ROMCU
MKNFTQMFIYLSANNVDDYSKPNRKLDSSENEIYKETDPLIKSYLSSSHSIKMKKDKMSLKIDVLELYVQENDPVTEVGAKLAEMAYDFEINFQPMVINLVDKFFDETRKMEGGVVQPSLKLLLKNYKTIAEEIFRNGYNWSRLLVILMFTFEIFQRLYVAYTPDVAKNLISHIGAVFVNIGLTAWVLVHGGWSSTKKSSKMHLVLTNS